MSFHKLKSTHMFLYRFLCVPGSEEVFRENSRPASNRQPGCRRPRFYLSLINPTILFFFHFWFCSYYLISFVTFSWKSVLNMLNVCFQSYDLFDSRKQYFFILKRLHSYLQWFFILYIFYSPISDYLSYHFFIVIVLHIPLEDPSFEI